MTSRRTERRKRRGDGARVDLQPGESLVMVAHPTLWAVWPKYLLSLGLYGLWRKRDVSVLTDRRLLVGRGIVFRTEHSIPIERINDAMYVRRGLNAYCEIASLLSGRPFRQQLGPLSARAARRFTEAIVSRNS